MKLSQAQLSAIKSFISKRGITYLDVQMEILDHVASAVEEKMNSSVTLSFDEALKQTHASFGIFGFGGVEDSIINNMSKKYNQTFWRIFRSFFCFKYILLLLLAGVFSYQALKYSIDYGLILLATMLVAMLFFAIRILIAQKNKGYNKYISFRLSATYLTYIGSLALVLNFIINHTANGVFLGLDITHFLSSAVIVILVIYILSAIKTMAIGKKDSELLMEKYNLLGY